MRLIKIEIKGFRFLPLCMRAERKKNETKNV